MSKVPTKMQHFNQVAITSIESPSEPFTLADISISLEVTYSVLFCGTVYKHTSF